MEANGIKIGDTVTIADGKCTETAVVKHRVNNEGGVRLSKRIMGFSDWHVSALRRVSAAAAEGDTAGGNSQVQ